MDHWRNQRGNWKYLEANDDKYTTFKNLWDATKAVLRGKFIAIQAHLRKQEKSLTHTKKKQPKFTSKAARERTDKTQS